MKKILAADLWPVVGLNETFGEAAAADLAAGQMRLKQLIENVLLYGKVIIPTNDLVTLIVLARSFGPEQLSELIDAGVVGFVRIKGLAGYVGNGGGLSILNAVRRGDPSMPLGLAWQPIGVGAKAVFAEIPGVTERRAGQLAVKVASVTKEVELGDYSAELKAATYTTIRSAALDPSLSVTANDLNRIPGAAANQVTVSDKYESPIEPTDDVAKLMRVARTEQERLAQRITGCDDLSTRSPIGKIISANGGRGGLENLIEITEVPDFGAGVLNGTINVRQIIELRDSRHWEEFANWFHETCASDPQTVAKEYVNFLKRPKWYDNPIVKTLRVLIPAGIGLVEPVSATAIAGADMFLTENLVPSSAKYFIDELEQLAPDLRNQTLR